MSRKKTKEEWQLESDKKHNNEFEIIGDVTNAITKVDILHKKCGKILNMTPHNHLSRYCKYCSNKYKRSKEEWQVLSDKIHNKQFIILDEPKNTKDNIRIKHKKCGNIINMTLNNHISHKNGCKQCSKQALKSHDYWVNKCKEIWGDDFKILDYIDNINSKVRVKHTICNNIVIKNMHNLIHNKRGCEICSKKAYGELYVKNYFDENNIKYEEQKTLKELINPKTNRRLKIDFYLPEYNTYIELDGVQHYKAIEHWGGEKAYKEQMYRDNIKNQFLGDKLIRINNKEITKIKKICQQLKSKQKQK